jgi:AbrB family looped-hinge helix DNA binding protein
MGSRTAATLREPLGRLGQRRQVVIPRSICETLQLQEGDVVAFVARAGGVLIKPKRAAADPDDVLNRQERALIKKAELEMSQGKCMTLAELKRELAHHRSPRSRKTA